MLARVFPRKTHASPSDSLAFFDGPPLAQDLSHIDKVHVSVTFSYDMWKAEELAREWEEVAPVELGGVAYGDPGGDFVPGRYLAPGYVITSRGCPNSCWFCDVPKREGGIRELPITDGFNLLDPNILACSSGHIRGVFEMLQRQKERVHFTGGLEALRLTDWHVSMLWQLRPRRMYFAYDTPDDLEPLIEAGKKLRYADFTRSHLSCYVLIGYPRDTFDAAYARLEETWAAGFMPMAMLWKNKAGDTDPEWARFQRRYARPVLTRNIMHQHYTARITLGLN